MTNQANQTHPIVIRVAALWGVSAAAVVGGGGNDNCERARQDAMALLRAVHSVTYRGLGQRFGLDQAQAKAAVRVAEARIRRDHVHAARLLNVLFTTADGRVAASTGGVR